MAIGNPVSYWYGTKAQYNALSPHLADTLYFITDEQTLYKGDVRFAEGVEQLSAVDSSAPSSPAKYDKYFNTNDGKIYVYDGTSWGNAYYPAEGNMYYDKNAKRFVYFVPTYDGTTVTGGSMADVYDAGVSGDSTQGVSIQGTSTVTVANASANGKGVVQVGSNLNISNGVISVPVATNAVFGVVKSGDNITNTNGIFSVGKATTSALGVVKVGSNINVDNNGQISVPVASTSVKGVIKVAAPFSISDGTLDVDYASTSAKGVIKIALPFSVSNGVLGIASATTSAKGVVQVGTNIDVNSGVISVKDASTSDKGVVQLVNDANSSDMGSQTRAITPHAVGQVVDDINQEINTKQDNLSNGNVTTVSMTPYAKIDVNVGDGITVGVAGSTNANKLIVNEASVKEVLEDVVDGDTEPAVNEIVTADNLHGALSVGQAVDVSCKPYNNSGSISYNEGGFLNGFTANMISGTKVGFYDTTDHKFPKFANNLVYLFIADVSGAGTVTPNGASAVTLSGTPQRIWTKVTTSNSGYISASANATMTVTNWRQYEVTALTDKAIEYIAKLPDPDAFFRSTDVSSIRDKYLVEQDMVCPWIKTIFMLDNSANLTVGAGLSYQIKYTKTGTYSVSVDTIPTDAYGWDAHISMFVKDTAVVQFQAPLILMDALTPNAGHDLSVKFRNGNAFVYVDDTNAGTVVYLATGTTTTKGSLPYALSQTPTSENTTFTNFVVFSPVLGGTVCSMGTMSNVAYSASLIGNVDDSTIVGGTIGFASGKYLAVQDINLNDVEITSGTLNIGHNVKVTGTTTNGVTGSGTGAIVLAKYCLLDFSDQTNNVPITGASISAVSGARAIPYGETESEAIGAGTGNAVTKYGKCGYLVSDASATTAVGTLYDALGGGGIAYKNVIFDPALDGSTVSIPESSSISVSRAFTIDGNGVDKTTLNIQSLFQNSGSTTHTSIKNLSLVFEKGINQDKGSFTIFNVSAVVNGGSRVFTTARGCTANIDHLNISGSMSAQGDSCILISNTSGADTVAHMTNCVSDLLLGVGITVQKPTGTGACSLYLDGGNTMNDVIVVQANTTATFSGTNIINANVSGAGTVVFANGATLDLSGNTNSTVISGGTIAVASGSTVSIIPYQGTAENPVVITGETTGSTLTNAGVLS